MPSAFLLVLQVKKMFWSNKLTAWILTMYVFLMVFANIPQ